MLINYGFSEYNIKYQPKMIWKPNGIYSDEHRQFQGVASITAASNGRLWATWYGGGVNEGIENYILLATSEDQGIAWKLMLIIDADIRASEPMVWIAPDRKLWLMWGQYPNGLCGSGSLNYRLIAEKPGCEDACWGIPEAFSHDITFNKPIILSTGRWLFPAGLWNSDEISRPLLSDNCGLSFYHGGPIVISEDRSVDEYMVVERKNNSLWLMVRTLYGLGECKSFDYGKTWTEVQPSRFAHVTSRFCLIRLFSGRLLWIRHGQVNYRLASRRKLQAFLSEDEGDTWIGGLTIDSRENVAYPDAIQLADGNIGVIYDRERYEAKEILFVNISESQILTGGELPLSSINIVNKAMGLKQHEK